MSFKSEDAYTTELQTVLRIAHALRDATGVSHLNQQYLSPVAHCPHALIDSINLPSPHPLLPSLLEAGFNHEIAVSISKAYQLRAKEFKRRIQESSATACREIAELPVVALASSPDALMRKFVFTFTELYTRRLKQWKEEIFQRIKRAPQTLTKAASKNSRTFNQVSIPTNGHTPSHTRCRNTFHYWSIFLKKTHSRRMRTRCSLPRSQIWSTGRSMYG